MENLENISIEGLKESEERMNLSKPAEMYEGLELLEDKPYQGPTSIKYWM